MPGVLVIEALAQAGGVLALGKRQTRTTGFGSLYLVGLDNARFKRPVRPGDQSLLKVDLVHRRRNLWRFEARAEVDGKLVVEAEFLLADGTEIVIDQRAVVASGARIAEDVYVGPYAVIGAEASIGSGSRIESHVVIKGADNDRSAKPHLSVRLDRRRSAGQEVQGRANAARDR